MKIEWTGTVVPAEYIYSTGSFCWGVVDDQGKIIMHLPGGFEKWAKKKVRVIIEIMEDEP